MRFWRIIVFLVSVIAAGTARAENFYIENYEVDVRVFKNKMVTVKEKISAVFTAPSHGIIRSIPRKGSEIYDIDVDEEYTADYGSSVELQIGNADELITGPKEYNLEFTQRILDNKPEFYYNLIGTDWNVPIQHASFRVIMPETVDENNVGISIGRYGTRGFDGEGEYVVDGSVITGQTRYVLQPGEGITVRIEVPKGYFDTAAYDKMVKAVWLGLFLCTFLAFIIWYLYGKDEHITPVVTFRAPEEMNGVDAELIMNEKVTEKGLIALIVKLANDGYFKIETKGKSFTLSDFQPYQGNNDNERELLLLLSSEADKDGKVTDKMLKISHLFYAGWNGLLEDANTNKQKSRFYEKTSVSGIFPATVFMCFVGNVMLTIFSLLGYKIYPDSLMLIAVVVFMLLLFVQTIIKKDTPLSAKLYMGIYAPFFILPIYGAITDYISYINTTQVVGGLLCILITSVCYVEMLKPNIKGRLLKGKLLGLKKFIEVAEKERLEKMVEENPSYFYKILPYAYILGVSAVWIKRFEGISMLPPPWAVNTAYNISSFNNFTGGFHSAVMPSIENGGISRSSTSSSGGGGFSGGGFGGGGGRSW